MNALNSAWLKELDRRRLDEPAAVASELKAAAPYVPQQHLPLFCATYGSALRLLGRVEEARATIRVGLKNCRNPHHRALLIQRMAAVEGQDNPALALFLVDIASILYSDQGDLGGLGQTKVDKGKWLFELGLFQEAIAALRASLDYLPLAEEFHQSRFSAVLGQGFCFEALGDPNKAIYYAQEACKLEKDIGCGLRLSLWWLKARLEKQLGNLVAAERRLEDILKYYTEKKQPLFAALASIELVAVQIELGNATKANTTVRTMAVYLEPLKGDRVAAAALTELIRASMTGTLTRTCVQSARALLKQRQPRSASAPTTD